MLYCAGELFKPTGTLLSGRNRLFSRQERSTVSRHLPEEYRMTNLLIYSESRRELARLNNLLPEISRKDRPQSNLIEIIYIDDLMEGDSPIVRADIVNKDETDWRSFFDLQFAGTIETNYLLV
jgi:hypothetical protein